MFGYPAGTDFTQPLTFHDRSGNVIDLTSATSVQAVVYPEPREGASASLTLTTANTGVVVTDAAAGSINLVMKDDNALTAGEYLAIITATLASGDAVELGRESIFVF